MRAIRQIATVLGAGAVACLLSGCGPGHSPDARESSPIDWTAVNRSVGECLADRGWDVSYDEDGSVLSEHPVEQSSAFMADNDDCVALNRPEEAEPTDEQWTAYFDSLKESAVCLEDMGYEISRPPSRDVFVQSYMEDPWLPHSEALRTASMEDREKILASCPAPMIG